ncbi:MAG: hypothetical protein AB7I48_08545 [Planctomycetaceae bacterium]
MTVGITLPAECRRARIAPVLLIVLACGSAGCGTGGYGESAEPGQGVPGHMAIQEARSMVYVLDYLVHERKLDQVPRLYNQMEYVYTDPSSAPHFSDYQEAYDRLKTLVAEVKRMLPEHRDNLEPVESRIKEMVDLADSLPGEEIKIAEVWDIQ